MAKQLENYLEDKNVQAFLALIRDTEGTAKGADPYRVYGGSPKNQIKDLSKPCLLYTSPSPRDQRGYRMPSSA